MGWDVFCIICGACCSSNDELGWMSHFAFLTQDNKVIEGCINDDDPGIFLNQSYSYTINPTDYNIFNKEYDNLGTVMHMACYVYVCNKYGLSKIYYKDLPILPKKNLSIDAQELSYIKFGSISKYWTQYFDINDVDKSDMYMFENPFENKRNGKRIDQIISKYKINKGRTGPAVSATFYPTGTIKFGENNKMWEKNGGKWIQLNIEVKTLCKTFKYSNQLTPNMKYINSISQIGTYSKTPLFISKISKDKKMATVEFKGSPECISKLEQKINKISGGGKKSRKNKT
jgi:hypothetical protein